MADQKVPNESQLIASEKHYSENGLWDKIKSVAKSAGLKIIYAALILYYTATASTTPTEKKAIIYGALGYFILPIDLIPDAIPLVGFSDDLAALLWCIATVAACITPEIKENAKKKLTEIFGQYDESEIEGVIK